MGLTLARVTTLPTITAPISSTPATPSAHFRYATMPSTHARSRIVTPMPTNSAALSLVPNVAMAKSFIHGGVKSMNVEPSAIRGVARAVKNAPISSATDRTTAAAATPATAARAVAPRDRLLGFMLGLSYRPFVAARPPDCLASGHAPR